MRYEGYTTKESARSLMVLESLARMKKRSSIKKKSHGFMFFLRLQRFESSDQRGSTFEELRFGNRRGAMH